MSTERAASRGKTGRSSHQRELELRRDIAEAFFNAQTPVEVYRLALARVTPLVNASFSSVFVRDASNPDLLKLVCANNWPQTSARYLGQLRIRLGRGPTGGAVAERRAIEVEDVFGDIAQRDWWEPAKELGFASLASLPLESDGVAIGAVTFYYAEPHQFNDEERELLALIAQQLSITAERASAQEALRKANEALEARIRDLEAQVGAAEELKRLKNEFVANISHELRTPLNAILGYTYLLLEGQEGAIAEPQQRTLRKIDASANLLMQLINDLLALSELKLGRMNLTVAPDDAVLLARRASEFAAPGAVQFKLSITDDRIDVRTDGEKVLKILENLLSNAFKFTQSGEVELSVRRASAGGRESVEWTVRDTGIGIPAENQTAIFDEFRQVDGSSTRLYGGTGLGLALSLRLARLLGGELIVDSEPGRGSTFILRIPVNGPQIQIVR